MVGETTTTTPDKGTKGSLLMTKFTAMENTLFFPEPHMKAIGAVE